jgi:hypothetical protein
MQRIEAPVSTEQQPIGDVGVDADGQSTDRDASGRFVKGNRASLVVGARSAAFWAAQDDARREVVAEVIADKGHDVNDAPAALRLAAESLSEAALIQRSAFAKLVEQGGPLTASGRTRRAFIVWQAATDRIEHHVRLLGLQRVAKPAPTLTDWLADQRKDDDR